MTRIERNDSELDAPDVETLLEFTEHVVLDARRMWSEFPLQHRRRMQKVLFPEGLVFDGEAFRTPVTCLFFRDLETSERKVEDLVARTGFEPCPLGMQGETRSHPVLDSLVETSMLGPARNLTAGGGRIPCKEGSSPVLFCS